MFEADKIISMPDDVYRLLRDFISDYCGIYFDDDSKYLMERRLSRRLQSHGLTDFRDFFRFLLYNRDRDRELSEIIDILTVNETYFFREDNQFKALITEIAPELRAIRRDSPKLRIWSAGCASGEEPYTIAMLVLENPSVFLGWEVEIIGSDINQRVLQKARSGIYTRNSFRSMDNYYLEKYFEPLEEGEGQYRIKDRVKELVTFNYINLLDPFKQQFLGMMDVVFCRNVLIYFHLEAKKKVIESFAQRINDGGYLLLGHAESLMNISSAFSLKHLKNDMVYQKPRKSSITMSNESLFRMVWGK